MYFLFLIVYFEFISNFYVSCVSFSLKKQKETDPAERERRKKEEEEAKRWEGIAREQLPEPFPKPSFTKVFSFFLFLFSFPLLFILFMVQLFISFCNRDQVKKNTKNICENVWNLKHGRTKSYCLEENYEKKRKDQLNNLPFFHLNKKKNKIEQIFNLICNFFYLFLFDCFLELSLLFFFFFFY
jgi:hypothetical protein